MRKFALICWSMILCAACAELPQTIEEIDNTASQSGQPETSDANQASTALTPSGEESAKTGVELGTLILDTRYQILGPGSSNLPTKNLATKLCEEIGAKLGSVDESDCLRQQLQKTGSTSTQGRDLAIKNYLPTDTREPLGRVLVIGGIHGDEFSSVSVVFKWMDILNEHHSGLFHWRFIPASNPDGLLNKKSQRQNANGVDLNRNFPTSDWGEKAKDHWVNSAYMQARRYPGESANSEPETQWLVEQINMFQPDVIVSMHAPYHLVDYDGPPKAPGQLGSLYLRKLGVFPGSLGNYAGVDLGIPIVTVELASAGSMPSKQEISDMWDDLVGWLRTKLSE